MSTVKKDLFLKLSSLTRRPSFVKIHKISGTFLSPSLSFSLALSYLYRHFTDKPKVTRHPSKIFLSVYFTVPELSPMTKSIKLSIIKIVKRFSDNFLELSECPMDFGLTVDGTFSFSKKNSSTSYSATLLLF